MLILYLPIKTALSHAVILSLLIFIQPFFVLRLQSGTGGLQIHRNSFQNVHEKVSAAVTLLICIREVFVSNLDREPGYLIVASSSTELSPVASLIYLGVEWGWAYIPTPLVT
jgi:hypothetical protein